LATGGLSGVADVGVWPTQKKSKTPPNAGFCFFAFYYLNDLTAVTFPVMMHAHVVAFAMMMVIVLIGECGNGGAHCQGGDGDGAKELFHAFF